MASIPEQAAPATDGRAQLPSTIARDALRRLTEMQLAPTPENFAQVYYEIARVKVGKSASGPVAALRDLATELANGPASVAAVGAALNLAIDVGDWTRVRELMRARCLPALSGSQANAAEVVEEGSRTRGCQVLLADALEAYVTEDLGFGSDLARQALELSQDIRDALTSDAITAVEPRVRALLDKAGYAGKEHRDILRALLRLLELITETMGEKTPDGSWLQSQLGAMADLSSGNLTLRAIEDLEAGLREIAGRQGTLRQSLEEAKDAMKGMVATFIERLGELADNATGYHDRLDSYGKEIEGASDVRALSSVVQRIMQDTRDVQSDLRRTREELVAARQSVEQFQERTTHLESELVTLADRLEEDQLTNVLNRRGLARCFGAEAARADRHLRPFSVAMLDLDNFKKLNDGFGHQAGDAALIHLTKVLRASLRVTDLVARYGGEEFVVLLPETGVKQAMSVLTRVQRDLANKPFQHNGQPVPMTFSAGVAERVIGESEEAVIARADAALYDAKKEGKNRVLPR